MKGVLPVPRRVFRDKEKGPDKASAQYLASVTPEPLERKSTTPKDPRTAGYVSWKARQAESRRQNLRESLIELQYRKQRTDRQISARSARKQAQNKVLRDAPEREDDRLTNPTVLKSENVVKHHLLPDPDRAARLARKRENVARTEAMKQEERQNALHTLYVNAGTFITTGAQLDKVIDKVFDNQDQFRNDMRPGMNVWNLGFPETVQELLGKPGKGSRAVDSVDANANVTKERMRKIAEELTGGKMEDAP